MHHQRGLIGGLPHARLITKILKFCGVDLTGEPKKKITSKDCEISVGATNMNMEIYKDKDEFFKHRDTAPSASSDAPIPKDGYANEVLYNKMCFIKNLITTDFCDIRLEIAELRK